MVEGGDGEGTEQDAGREGFQSDERERERRG